MDKRDTHACKPARSTGGRHGNPVLLERRGGTSFSVTSGRARATNDLQRFGRVPCQCEETGERLVIYEVSDGSRVVFTQQMMADLEEEARDMTRQLLKRVKAM